MKPPLRIAILECDTPLVETKAKYGGYGGVFKALLETAADALDQPDLISSKKGLELTTFDVVTKQEYPELDSIDAVLLTGSSEFPNNDRPHVISFVAGFDSFADEPWILKLVDFTKKLLEQDHIRIIGVCFGHQIVGRAIGVGVGRSEGGWEVSVLPVELTQKGKELFEQDTLVSQPSLLFRSLTDWRVQSLHQMHRDAVYEYPPDAEKLGASPRCLTQGMYVKGKYITVQGHPEFNEQIVSEIVTMRHGQGVFTDDQAEDALSRVGNHHDGVAVGKGFLRFLLED
jgi:GMP synthase-like glutamine amidotransferase